MRKELKSKSRRKWLLGGSLAFASVALLTTGFATWVIGVSKPSGDGQADIDVDTVQDKSVELTFSLNENKIFVAENVGKSNPNLTIEREEADTKPDWNIEIKDLKIVVGKEFYNESLKGKKNLKIAFELQKDKTEDTNSATNSVTEDKVGVRGETGSPWSYIDIDVKSRKYDVNLPDPYPADGKIYDINDTLNNPDKTFSFTWGSYFDGKAPSEFYKLHEPKEGQREYYQKAGQEFAAMRAALKGTLKLTATFDYGQNGQTVGK